MIQTPIKGGLISEKYFDFGPIAKKRYQITAENLNQLFTVMGGKFKLSAQGRDLAPFVGNGTKVKIPSEIKPPLIKRFENCNN